MTRHKGHVKKADERLTKKKADQDKEHEVRLQAVQTLVSKEYSSKFKKQEDHFRKRSREDARRIKQLEGFNVSLCASNSRAKAARDCAIEACARIQADLDSLTADM